MYYYFPHFYRWKNQGTERLRNLPVVPQLLGVPEFLLWTTVPQLALLSSFVSENVPSYLFHRVWDAVFCIDCSLPQGAPVRRAGGITSSAVLCSPDCVFWCATSSAQPPPTPRSLIWTRVLQGRATAHYEVHPSIYINTGFHPFPPLPKPCSFSDFPSMGKNFTWWITWNCTS